MFYVLRLGTSTAAGGQQNKKNSMFKAFAIKHLKLEFHYCFAPQVKPMPQLLAGKLPDAPAPHCA